jgi:hypothetical protein
MYVFVAHTHDVAALWLYRQLLNSGFQELELLSIEQIQYNQSFTMTQQGGKAAFHLVLQDGKTFSTHNVCGLINRAESLDGAFARAFQAAEQNYVQAEMAAILTFWGSAFGENAVFNAVTTAGFGGRRREAAEWYQLAATAGFRTPDWFQDENGAFLAETPDLLAASQDLLVFRGRCFSATREVPPALAARCLRLQACSEQALLGIRVAGPAHDPLFVSASTQPDLRCGGTAFVQYLKNYLDNGLTLWHSRRRAL